jgi:hypothetical protein
MYIPYDQGESMLQSSDERNQELLELQPIPLERLPVSFVTTTATLLKHKVAICWRSKEALFFLFKYPEHSCNNQVPP